MHRSGTSLVARLLDVSGLYLGSKEELFQAGPDNPFGYHENKAFHAIDEAILAHFGGTWSAPPDFPDRWEEHASLNELREQAQRLVHTYANRPKWGWKDPRSSLLIPFWKSLIPELRFVVCIRNPLDVARSLQARDGWTLSRGMRLWTRYVRSLVRDIDESPALFVSYEEILRAPEAEKRRLAQFARLPGRMSSISTLSIVSADHQHHRTTLAELVENDRLALEDKLLYLQLCDYAYSSAVRSMKRGADNGLARSDPASRLGVKGDEDGPTLVSCLGTLLAESNERVRAESRDVSRLSEECAQLRETLRERNEELERIFRSSGWRFLCRLRTALDALHLVRPELETSPAIAPGRL